MFPMRIVVFFEENDDAATNARGLKALPFQGNYGSIGLSLESTTRLCLKCSGLIVPKVQYAHRSLFPVLFAH
jgi:hypothetical protein